MTIEHIGIAVKDMEASNQLFEKLLGIAPYKTEKVDSEHVDTSFFQLGASKIELLHATQSDSAIAKFIEKKGEGIHHIAYGVPDVAGALASAAGRGLALVDEVPRPGARNTMTGFVDPGLPGGTLVEYVQDPQLNIELAHSPQLA